MKSISQKPSGSQIPASEESGPQLAACQENDGPVPYLAAEHVDGLTPIESLPRVDWGNITKDPRLEDLEVFESHDAGCQCGACWRTTLRMSSHPEIASAVP